MHTSGNFKKTLLFASSAAAIAVLLSFPSEASSSSDIVHPSGISGETFLRNLTTSIERHPDLTERLVAWGKEYRPDIAHELDALFPQAGEDPGVRSDDVENVRAGNDHPVDGAGDPDEEAPAVTLVEEASSEDASEAASDGVANDSKTAADDQDHAETTEAEPPSDGLFSVEETVDSFGDPANWMKALLIGGASFGVGAFSLSSGGSDGGDGSYDPGYSRKWENPTPLPPPTYGDTPADFETEEYRAMWGLGTIKASDAYARQLSGEGVVLALMDDGIDLDHPEFKNRIVDPYNALYRNENMNTSNGHGTSVAGIMAGARDGEGMHGVAWSAQILPMSMADTNKKFQAGEGGENPARGWRHAAHHGAKAINNSWSFNDRWLDNTSKSKVREIAGEMLKAGRHLVEKDVITVFSTGNNSRQQPSVNAGLPYYDSALKSHWIAVGSVNSRGELSNFSNHCGKAADWCMVAPGGGTLTPSEGGGYRAFSGTSAAAPHVTGAIGVLYQAFPYMKGEEIVQLLFETADDIGPKEIYGHGLLNLERATRPVGETRIPLGADIAGAAESLSGSSLRMSAAFGDGIAEALSGRTVMVLDAYNRGYDIDLASFASRPGQNTSRDALHRMKLFGGAEERSINTINSGPFSITTAARLKPSDVALGNSSYSRMSFSFSGSGYRMEAAMNPDLGRQFGFREASFGGTPMMDVRSFNQPHLAMMETGYSTSFGFNLNQDSDLQIAAFSGNVASEDQELFSDAPSLFGGIGQVTTSLGERFTLKAALGAVSEEGSMLGSLSKGAFGENMKSNTMFANLGVAFDVTSRTRLTFAGSLGQTSFKQNAGLIRSGDDLVTSSFGVGMHHQGLFQDDDTLSLAVSQPLRVESGAIKLSVPTSRGMDGSIGYRKISLSPQPSGREINLQASYGFHLAEDIEAAIGAMHRFDADHVAGRQETLGMVSLSFKF